MYLYIRSERHVYTVGCYKPDSINGGEKWEPESDHGTAEEAATRVNYLNGGTGIPYVNMQDIGFALVQAAAEAIKKG